MQGVSNGFLHLLVGLALMRPVVLNHKERLKMSKKTEETKAQIIVSYMSKDGKRKDKRAYATLENAQKYAQTMVGTNPKMGKGMAFATSEDGENTIAVEGCKLAELFPDRKVLTVIKNETKVKVKDGKAIGYKGHNIDSRKGIIHEIFDTKGPEIAKAAGLELKLKEGTLNSWFSAWRKKDKPDLKDVKNTQAS